MKSEIKIVNKILQISKNLCVSAVALSGLWTTPDSPKDEF